MFTHQWLPAAMQDTGSTSETSLGSVSKLTKDTMKDKDGVGFEPTTIQLLDNQ